MQRSQVEYIMLEVPYLVKLTMLFMLYHALIVAINMLDQLSILRPGLGFTKVTLRLRRIDVVPLDISITNVLTIITHTNFSKYN